MLLLIIGVVLTFILFFLARPIIVLFRCPADAISYATDYLKIYALGALFLLY